MPNDSEDYIGSAVLVLNSLIIFYLAKMFKKDVSDEDLLANADKLIKLIFNERI